MLRSAPTPIIPRLSRENWNIGVIPQPVENIVRNGITGPIHWWPDCPPYEMLADPSCFVEPDGTYVVFAEHLDYRVGRGEIWAGRARTATELTRVKLQPWLWSRHHLSYPQPVVGPMNTLFFMAETGETGALHLWRRGGTHMLHVGEIISEPLLDPTPWYDGTLWWLFCTSRREGPNDRLLLFYATDLQGPWTPHPRNPVKIDSSSSRPAGPLFRVDGSLYRPAQDCATTYGGGIQINRVICLDKSAFEEVAVRRLEPDPGYPDGLHTICSAGDVTLVDGKRWSLGGRDILNKAVMWAGQRLRSCFRPALPPKIALPAPCTWLAAWWPEL